MLQLIAKISNLQFKTLLIMQKPYILQQNSCKCSIFLYFITSFNSSFHLYQLSLPMSHFQTLQLNQTLEISPSLLIASMKPSIWRSGVMGKLKNEQKYDMMGQSLKVSEQCIGLKKVCRQPYGKIDCNIIEEHKANIKLSDSIGKKVKFTKQYYKKISENSSKIQYLNFKVKASKQTNPIKSPYLLNFNKIKSPHQTLECQTQKPFKNIQCLTRSLRIIQKTLQHGTSLSKPKKPVYYEKFKQILSSLSVQFDSSVIDSRVRICMNNSFIILMKVTDTDMYATCEIVFEVAVRVIKKYQQAMDKAREVLGFIEFLLVSDSLQIYDWQQQCVVMNDCHSLSQTQKQQSDQSQKEDFQLASFMAATQIITKTYTSDRSAQQSLQKIVQKIFLQYFVKQDKNPLPTKHLHLGSPYLSQQHLFNTYQHHIKPSNLSSFVPSYQDRSHFLLDKFTQTQNIFDDQQKLLLLLKLSRDPYVPRSSAKYISQIGAIVEGMIAREETERQDENQNGQKRNIQRKKEDREVDEELSQWDKMFGDLMLSI